jgi:hypothetical protein
MTVRWISLASLGLAMPALAAGSSAPLPLPDPSAANATPAEISRRAYDGCVATQPGLLGTTRDAVQAPCNCYAKRTVARMSGDEIANFRRTGYFDDATRAKALEAIDQCKLRRPI